LLKLETESEIKDAMDNLTGEIYGSFRSAVVSDRYLRDAMNRRMQVNPHLSREEGQRLPSNESLWASMWGFNGEVKDTLGNAGDAAPIRHSGRGLTAGISQQFKDNEGKDSWFAGVNAAKETSQVRNRDNRNSRMDMDNYSVGAFVAKDFAGDVQLRAGATHSQLYLRSRREINVPGLESTAQANYRGTKQQVFVELSTDIAIGTNKVLAPYVNGVEVRLRTDRAMETGSVAALEIAAQSDRGREFTAGVRGVWQLGTVKPTALVFNVARVRATGSGYENRASTQFADGTGRAFSVAGAATGRDSTLVSVGFERKLTPKTSIRLGYHGQFGGGRSYHSGNLQFKRVF